jgi:tetratricopeptide (TPR) repeat protein
MRLFGCAVLFAVFSFVGPAFADDAGSLCSSTGQIAHRWDVITYTLHDEARESTEMAALMDRANKVAAACPMSPGALIWSAIGKFSYASYIKGLKGFGLVKEARTLLEKALSIDPKNSVAMANLGFLYYQVPGFPIGFGSDKKARQLLQQSLAIAPDDIDAIYFYGEFLAEKGDYRQAETTLDHALKVAPEPGRKIGYEGRKKDVEDLLQKISHNINDRS